ncbi:MAG: hypothetical protein IJJ28_05180 [Lentisphaeria bacterium]|nr:hypothetical protein [Lentisphaeria bacterium]
MRFKQRVPMMLSAAVLLLAMLCGCSDPVVFAEALQMRKGDKVYTKYNLWYTDPEDISCLNIQSGSFIPIGTEVVPLYTSTGIFSDSIRFKDTAGREYLINFDTGHRMEPMRDFIAKTFTTKNRDELLKDVPAVIRPRVLRGEVVPGMNQAQVLLAYGPPPAIRTPDLRNESWIYWIGKDKTIRLVFRGDRVTNIININQN